MCSHRIRHSLGYNLLEGGANASTEVLLHFSDCNGKRVMLYTYMIGQSAVKEYFIFQLAAYTHVICTVSVTLLPGTS